MNSSHSRGEGGPGAFWARIVLLFLIIFFLTTEVLVFLCYWVCKLRPPAPEAHRGEEVVSVAMSSSAWWGPFLSSCIGVW